MPLFEAQGYGNMDQIMQLTWEDFEDFGVKRLGHLKKLVCAIKKLKDSRHQRNGSTSDGNCMSGVGEVLLINVPPQRSTAEIRPYSHLMHGQHSPQTMTTFQHSPRALSASQVRNFCSTPFSVRLHNFLCVFRKRCYTGRNWFQSALV